MKKEARLLKEKSLNSLTLSIDHFNRPWDVGRTDAVLMLLDHSFEMVLKAAILHRGGRIRDPGEKNTIGFDACVRRALSTPKIQFLTEEQALTLQAINGLRDAAQHHLVDISEGHLYLQAQSGITLYRDLLKSVFGEELRELLPDRVLPIATIAPLDPMPCSRRKSRKWRVCSAPASGDGLKPPHGCGRCLSWTAPCRARSSSRARRHSGS